MPGRTSAPSGPARLVALVFGGPEGEHEVSCESAAGIAGLLDPGRYLVQLVYLTKAGRWAVGPAAGPAGAATVQQLRDLVQHGTATAGRYPPVEVLAAADVVVPALHGPFGEDGTMQALLDAIGVPYAGSGVAASALCFDKDVSKRVLASYGIPVTPWVTLDGERSSLATDDQDRLGVPVFVKPARGGSSVGVSKVSAWDDLGPAVAEARRWDRKVLVEQAVTGREIDLAVLEYPSGKLEVGPALEIHYPVGKTFFDYAAKYRDAGTEFVIPAPLAPATSAELDRLTLRVFSLLGCRGLARVDFLLDGDRPVFNEVNTFPGFTAASQYPRMWAARNLKMPALLDCLIDTAVAAGRPGDRR